MNLNGMNWNAKKNGTQTVPRFSDKVIMLFRFSQASPTSKSILT